MHKRPAQYKQLISMSSGNWAANALRTNSAQDGTGEPTKIQSVQRVHIAKAVPKRCECIVGNKHRLHKFKDIDAINEIFNESSVVRKCQIV